MQVGSTLIAGLGFGGYSFPDGFTGGKFVQLSNGRNPLFLAASGNKVPRANTEAEFVQSIIGCGYESRPFLRAVECIGTGSPVPPLPPQTHLRGKMGHTHIHTRARFHIAERGGEREMERERGDRDGRREGGRGRERWERGKG